jgi:uncharacterized protein (TIGR02594 family)
MVQFTAFRRSLRFSTLAVCSAAIVSLATPASARPHHGAGHHARGHHAHRHFKRHYGIRHLSRRFARADSATALMRLHRFANTNASIAPLNSTLAGAGSSNVVAEARRYIGTGNPTGRSRLWCARFMNMVLERSGFKGTGSDMARSFASYGQRVSGPQIGAIAVMARRGGGHVGIVSGFDANGNPILVSGNNGNRVREVAYPRGRIYAYVMPTG